jgi:hypothetical protein
MCVGGGGLPTNNDTCRSRHVRLSIISLHPDTLVWCGRSLSILVNGAAGNFLATSEDLKTKGFRVRLDG